MSPSTLKKPSEMAPLDWVPRWVFALLNFVFLFAETYLLAVGLPSLVQNYRLEGFYWLHSLGVFNWILLSPIVVVGLHRLIRRYLFDDEFVPNLSYVSGVFKERPINLVLVYLVLVALTLSSFLFIPPTILALQAPPKFDLTVHNNDEMNHTVDIAVRKESGELVLAKQVHVDRFEETSMDVTLQSRGTYVVEAKVGSVQELSRISSGAVSVSVQIDRVGDELEVRVVEFVT